MEQRYEKQEMCSFIGEAGQRKIRQKHVLVVGAGALGSASSEMLVRAESTQNKKGQAKTCP